MASISSENDPRSTRSSAKRRKKQSSKTDPLESSKVSGIEDGVDHLLPERVLGSASYNTNSKLNIYSTPEFLGDIAKILAGSSDFERLLKSQFGKLFKYPVCQTAYSARLIHSLLCRQLVTKKRHELWFVFGGKPLRFSLREFHITTGLECKPIPSKEDIKSHQKEEEIPVWKRLFGSRVNVTAFDVSDMLKDDLKLPDDKKMSCWKRFSLVLILLVDGVIVCSNKDLNITPEYVKMLDDHPFFLSYPWGREAFSNTMERFGPPAQSKTDPITELKARLCQMSSCCYGFPLALQMLAFEAIPLLLSKIPNPNDKRDYTQMTYADLSTILILNQKDILKVEADKQVAYTLVGDESVENMDFGWDEDAVDVKVDYMEKLLIEGHEFTQSEWPCVDTSSPCVTVKSGTNTDTSGLVPPPPGGVKKAPTRRGGVKKEPAKRGGNAEKKKKDDVEKKDDGDTIEMLKHFIIEQHKETVSTLKKEMEKLFEGLTKCDCGGLRFPKNTTTEQNQEDGKDNTTTEQNQEDGKANTTTEQNQEGGKTDVEVINLETGNTARGKKKRKRSERESWKCPEEGVDREEGESFANSYERNRWNEAYTGVQNIIESVDKVDISAPQDTTKEDSPQGMEFENDYVSGDDSPFAEHNAFAVVPSGLENGHEQTCWEPINADRKSFRESVDRVDMSDPQETAKEDSLQLQGMEFENECVSGDDSRIAEHNAFVILPSTLESVHEETCGEPKIAERKTFGEECLASSPKTPEELVNNKRVPRASRFVKGGEYTGDPKLKALFARKQKAPEYRPMSCVDLKEFYELKQLLVDNEELTFEIVTKHIVTYRFFLDIAEAQKPLETKHVQVIMSMLWRRRGEVYTKVRAAFIDTWFLTLLQQKYKNFKACKNKKKFNWGVNLRTFVTGRARARTPTTFLQHIDLVYIPMKWSTSHWVGLVINLRLCKVQVFDPLIEARSDEEVNSVMAPVVEMIPWLVKEAVGKNYTKNFSTDPLTWERVKGLYQNQRGGDSGPVATKFLEMHAYGLRTNDMRMITDEVVDEFRKVYAMDAYVEFIESGEAKKP
ncbi:unnamed protein product [Arabidopsis arenosa]|uniref:Ubiquitin-like protease family profile domain-containing protein n=1 Tax=Arabidopsis arenosa TaxID=38785 RepID=A0A8S2B5Y8_ARAAE|nr:unnamed protein product [Arabidopsis arenosa]